MSTPTVRGEALTHASTVLVHLAVVSWKASGRWPLDAAIMDTAEISDNPSVHPQAGGIQHLLATAASTIAASLFPAFGSEEEKQTTRYLCDDVVGGGISELLASFMPLPPSSALALCRALIHVVNQRVLLVSYVVQDPTEPAAAAVSTGNLLLGPILRTVLRLTGAESCLQQRFFALQVRDGAGRARQGDNELGVGVACCRKRPITPVVFV